MRAHHVFVAQRTIFMEKKRTQQYKHDKKDAEYDADPTIEVTLHAFHALEYIA